MLSSSTNKYIQKADEVTGVSVSMRSWKEKSKDILASPYWLPIPILTYPLDFWQKIFAAGIHQQKNASGIPS